jgi:RHS repeat-associated protein
VGASALEGRTSDAGRATIRIPLTVPPGTAGLEPKLALSYSSAGGNGLLGVGMSLEGLSTISRCPRTQAQDGRQGGISYDSGDRYCLDGERLIAISGADGADGTEYRTERETFSRIVSHGQAGSGPTWFEVRTRAGQTMEFGSTEDSRIEAQNRASVRLWAISRLCDTSHNCADYKYEEDSATGEYRPMRIAYGRNDQAGTAADNSIQFVYEARSDVLSLYQTGGRVGTSSRLAAIHAFSGSLRTRAYYLEYEHSPSTGRSRLTRTTECAQEDGDCLSPTVFHWQQGPDRMNVHQALLATPYIAPRHGFFSPSQWDRVWVSDVTGDGLPDVVGVNDGGIFVQRNNGTSVAAHEAWLASPYISPRNGFFETSAWAKTWLTDVTGDGLPDIVGINDGGIFIHRNTGTAFLSHEAWLASPYISPRHNFFSMGLNPRVWITDVNGDGLPDILGINDGGIFVHRNTGSSFLPHEAWLSSPYIAPGRQFFDSNLHARVWVTDVNGDGLPDIVGINDGGIFVHRNTGTGFLPHEAWLALPYISPSHQFFGTNLHSRVWMADVNGDGLPDIVGINDGGIFVHRNTGTSFLPHEAWLASPYIAPSHQFFDSNYLTRVWLADVTGDGLPEVLGINDGGVFIHRNSGSQFLPHEAWLPSPYIAPRNQFFDLSQRARVSLADINGDGLTDVLGMNDGGIFWHPTTNGSPNAQPDLLLSATNGLGAFLSFEYASLTQPGVHTKDATSQFPIVDVQVPAFVVSSMSKSDGLGGVNRTRYSYGGARVDLSGRGFLGFRYLQSKDEASGQTVMTEYRQDYPYTGLVSKTEKSLNGLLWSRVIHEYSAVPLGGTRHFTAVSKSTDTQYELDGSLVSSSVTSTTYDAYGNALEVLVSFSDGYSKKTSNSYLNDTSRWILGQLVQSRVTGRLADGSSHTRTSVFTNDADTGRRLREIDEPELPALRRTVDYSYDRFGNKTSSTLTGSGMPGRVSNISYDSQGRFPISAVNPLGHRETRVYDAGSGLTLSVTGPNGLTTAWYYDGFGKKIGELKPDGNRSTWVYSNCDSSCPPLAKYLVTANSPGSPTTKSYFDALNREVRTELLGFDGTPVYRDTEYDALGRVKRSSRPYYRGAPVHWTSFVYDALGRTTREIHPGGGSTQSEYFGLTTRVTNALGQVQTKVRDPRGHLLQAVDAQGNVLRHRYDAAGNLVQTIDAHGNVILLTYDLRGQKTSVHDGDLGHWTYQYNALGELVSQSDAKGQITTFAYDKLGRLVSRNEADLQSSWQYDSAPNGIGKLAKAITHLGHQRELTYDSLGRPAGETVSFDGELFVMKTSYDAQGRVEMRTYPTGFAFKNVYNMHGYLSEVRNGLTQAIYWRGDAMDAEGRPSQFIVGNGLTTVQNYDAATGLLLSTSVGPQGSVQRMSYRHDGLGNLVEREDAVSRLRENFEYDNLNRLVTSSSPSYETRHVRYDALGNITFKSEVGNYSYGSRPHAVAATSGVLEASYVYDANGNMLSGAGRSIAYTSFNMPATIEQGGSVLSFSYDAEHARTKRSGPEGTEYYLNPRIDLGGHYEKLIKLNGQVEHKHYLYAGADAIGVYTTRSDGAAQTRYFLKDSLQSIVGITDESGAVVERFSYDAWGKRVHSSAQDAHSGAVESTHHGFTGHEHLPEVGLIHMNGRVYDPVLGRFLTADPNIQFPDNGQSLNRYSYVLNGPLSHTDPSGYFSLKSIVRSFVAAVASYYTFGAVSAWAATTASGLAVSVQAATVIGHVVGGAAAGFVSGAVQSGSLSGGRQGVLHGALFSYLSYGNGFQDPFAQVSRIGQSLGDAGEMLKLAGNYAKNEFYSRIEQRLAEKAGMSPINFNNLLMSLSITGNAVTNTSRFQEGRWDRFPDTEGRGLNGFFNRGVVGLPFDAVDTVLGFQGLPTASSRDFLSKGYKGMSVSGHSLGALDVIQLTANGLSSGGTVYALPFGNVAPPGVRVVLGDLDLVNGGILGKLFNWDAEIRRINPDQHGLCNFHRNCR